MQGYRRKQKRFKNIEWREEERWKDGAEKEEKTLTHKHEQTQKERDRGTRR